MTGKVYHQKKDIPVLDNGKLIIVTAPSGAGKTTIVKHLLRTFPELAFSVSATSRPARVGEVHGKDYFFFSPEEFRRLREDGSLLEWEEVYEGRFYGTLKREVEGLWAAGKHVVFDIDVRGAMRLQKKYPDRTLSIFIRPPSAETLEVRLIERHTEDEQSLRARLERARFELTCESAFQHTVVNDDLATAFSEAERLVRRFIEQ